ncbi:alkaline phosphatase [Geoalkalibacter ferrihydriticus]|uniref:Alkaline phosphatase n=1 Tax=Geoalkalibacter ferrihydriticus TaxID=392333 RepID=A0A1G9U698_9BACT|nr:alkaline phosphatase [Geoalkalibacter ferrihydriticus]SDM55085.1 alkaline phosphatase [Geoalkalibacter ferrihydriticus]
MFERMRKNATAVAVSTCLTLVATSAFAGWDYDHPRNNARSGNLKNAIIMIPDGCNEAIQTLARWYKGDSLHVDLMQPGTVKTHMANSVIAGSAAAGTSVATGHKTTVRFLGVGPRENDLLTALEPTAAPYAPIANIMEAAQREGKSVGLVATSRITHATPAAFGVHIHNRGWDNEIMEHLVYNNFDVVLGGGARHLLPQGELYTTAFGAEWAGSRADGENLMDELLERGYQFVDNKDDLWSISSGKVWGLFNASHMQPDIDREYFAPTEPSLAEMTAKAIEILSQNPKGFVLMVEGSQVDWAGHNNDPIYMVTDFLAFDEAVGVAKEFAKNDRKTLVMAYPDHNTGGMTIGHYTTAVGYTATKVEDLIDPLKGMTTTANGVIARMYDGSDFALAQSVRDNWSIELSDEDIAEIRALQPSVGLSYALARTVSKNHTVIGWTTHGHTGETVPLWMVGTPAPSRVIDNTELAYIAANAIGVDLDRTTQELFVDLDEVTSNYTIDTRDPANPVVMVGGAALPVSKDYMIKNNEIIQLPGLTVYAPVTGKVYVSRQAIKELDLNKKRGQRGVFPAMVVR